MAGTVIEVLSTKKMMLLAIALLLLQTTFFLIGGLVAPKPSDAQEHIMTNCLTEDETGPQDVITKQNCHVIHDLHDPTLKSDKIVLMTYIPRPPLKMIPWFQYLLGLLQVKITYQKENPCKAESDMLLDVNILYSDEADFKLRQQPGTWTSLARCEEERILECSVPHGEEDKNGYECDCEILHLFQLGSVPHKYYLVNIRLPLNKSSNPGKEYNRIGHTEEMSVISIRQTGGFTKVWMALKTGLTFIILFPIIWFWRRIRMLERAPLLIEKAIFSLAISMLFLDLPVELVSIYFEAPWMLFFTDVRQGFFYAILLSFWIIFLGEHLMDQPHRNKISAYRCHLGTIFSSVIALLVFDIAERGMQLTNPCTTVWTHHKIAMGLIVVASIGGVLYFLMLVFMVVKVFQAISYKRRFMLPVERQKKFKSLVFRFRLLMVLTVATAGLTIVFYVLSQKYDNPLDFGEYHIEVNSAFFTGVYGLWNIYVLLVLSAYAPSHKTQNVEDSSVDVDSRHDLIALNSATDYGQTRIQEQLQILELTRQKVRED